MRGRAFFAGLLLAFGLELALLALFSAHGIQRPQDTVAVNEIVQTVRRDWDDLEAHVNVSGFDYVVLGADGAVLYRTRPGLSESVNAGIAHRDTMLDVEAGGTSAGKLIIYNDDALTRQLEKRAVAAAAAAAMLLQLGICAGYFYYLRRTMVIPFRKLERFAQRVGGGNRGQTGHPAGDGSAQPVRGVYRELRPHARRAEKSADRRGESQRRKKRTGGQAVPRHQNAGGQHQGRLRGGGGLEPADPCTGRRCLRFRTACCWRISSAYSRCLTTSSPIPTNTLIQKLT